MDILKIQSLIIRDYIVVRGQNIWRKNLTGKSDDIKENYIMDGNAISFMIFGGNIVKSILECQKWLPDRGMSSTLYSLNVQKTE